VACPSVSDCWAVGVDSIQHWDGTAWTLALQRTNTTFVSVSCPTTVRCMAIGFDPTTGGSLAYRLVRQSWAVVKAPTAKNNVRFLDIACPSISLCWTVGYTRASHIDTRAYAQWNGTQWLYMPTTAQVYYPYASIACRTTSNCWAVGAAIADDQGVPTTAYWDGASWSAPQPVPIDPRVDPFGGAFESITCLSVNNCWAAGILYLDTADALHPAVARWNGSEWRLQSVPAPPARSELTGISCHSAGATSLCKAVGYSREGDSYSTLVESRGP
jgi:hypothetical protein